jgi:hypothetical protein
MIRDLSADCRHHACAPVHVSANLVAGGRAMKHYRINKLAEPEGPVVKRKDVLANDHKQAVDIAAEDSDCPVCEVWHAGEQIAKID